MTEKPTAAPRRKASQRTRKRPPTQNQRMIQDLQDKLNKAWRMVRYLGHGELNTSRAWLFSLPEISEATSVDTPTIAAMRARYMDLREAGREPVGDWWTDVKRPVLTPSQRP